MALGAWLFHPHQQRAGFKAAFVALGLLLVPLCLGRYAQGVDRMMAKVRGGGPAALALHDRLAVYGLNGAMGASGILLGAPEAGVETLLLMVPSSGTRRWRSQGFPHCAPKVGDLLRRQQGQAQAGGQTFATQTLVWEIGERGTSARAGLALNTLEVRTRREGPMLHTESVVEVAYVANVALPLARLGPLDLRVEQGLFHALEQLGWLHPYAMHYESRIGVLEPLPARCEAWSVRLGRSLRPG